MRNFPNYINYRRKMSLETLLSGYIINFSVFCIFIFDDVTRMVYLEDQCREKNNWSGCKQSRNKTYLKTDI